MNPDTLPQLDDRLRELVDLSSLITTRARRERLDSIMRRARSIGYTLHAARDMLDQIGSEYADAARAYVAAGERMLHDLNDEMDRAEIVGDHAYRLDPVAVVAWMEYVGLVITPWQRSHLDRLVAEATR